MLNITATWLLGLRYLFKIGCVAVILQIHYFLPIILVSGSFHLSAPLKIPAVISSILLLFVLSPLLTVNAIKMSFLFGLLNFSDK